MATPVTTASRRAITQGAHRLVSGFRRRSGRPGWQDAGEGSPRAGILPGRGPRSRRRGSLVRPMDDPERPWKAATNIRGASTSSSIASALWGSSCWASCSSPSALRAATTGSSRSGSPRSLSGVVLPRVEGLLKARPSGVEANLRGAAPRGRIRPRNLPPGTAAEVEIASRRQRREGGVLLHRAAEVERDAGVLRRPPAGNVARPRQLVGDLPRPGTIRRRMGGAPRGARTVVARARRRQHGAVGPHRPRQHPGAVVVALPSDRQGQGQGAGRREGARGARPPRHRARLGGRAHQSAARDARPIGPAPSRTRWERTGARSHRSSLRPASRERSPATRAWR